MLFTDCAAGARLALRPRVRATLALAVPAALLLAALTACEETGPAAEGSTSATGTEDVGTGTPGTGTGTGSAGTGGGDHGLNTDIPCGQILDCNTLCSSGDQACYDSCFDGAYPHGQELYTTLDTCFVDNGCQDWTCLEEKCADELAACEADIPPGGHVCFASGIYEVCDEYGYCDQVEATGGGWGATESYAAFWGEYDCNDHMTIMMIINNLNGISRIVSDCVTTSCSPN